jgi:hypothetical protein
MSGDFCIRLYKTLQVLSRPVAVLTLGENSHHIRCLTTLTLPFYEEVQVSIHINYMKKEMPNQPGTESVSEEAFR